MHEELMSAAGAVEYCLPETLNVTCALDEIIMVTSAKYGRMRSGRCIKQNYGHVGNCDADVTAYVEDQCSGRRHCQLPVSRLLAVAAPCPPDVTSYLDATYGCVKGETSHQSTIVTRRRSVAKSVGCFQRRLFVCVCLFVNAITSERVNIG